MMEMKKTHLKTKEGSLKRNYWKIYSIILTTIVVLCACLFMPVYQWVKHYQNEKKGYWNDVPWHTLIDDMNPKAAKIMKEGVIENYHGLKGVVADVSCVDDFYGLGMVHEHIYCSEDCKYNIKEVNEKLIDKFDLIYGKHEQSEENIIWKTKYTEIKFSFEYDYDYIYIFYSARLY